MHDSLDLLHSKVGRLDGNFESTNDFVWITKRLIKSRRRRVLKVTLTAKIKPVRNCCSIGTLLIVLRHSRLHFFIEEECSDSYLFMFNLIRYSIYELFKSSGA